MKTDQAILFSTLIFPVFSEICDAPGECTKSIYLTNVPAIDTFDCWKKCRYHEGCNFGTYTGSPRIRLPYIGLISL